MRILFLLISAMGLLTAAGTVLARNLIHAALFLIAFFFLIACQFLLLDAEFLAVVQVLIYIGAVAILLMFGIMLTRNVTGDETTTVRLPAKIPAAIAGLGILTVLLYGIGEHSGLQDRPPWTEVRVRPGGEMPAEPDATPTVRARALNDMGRWIGYEMLTRYVVPFEVAGLLLTAALVGAIALATLDEPAETPKPGPARSVGAKVGGNGQPAAGGSAGPGEPQLTRAGEGH